MGYCQPSIDMSEYKKISEITRSPSPTST